MAKKKGITIAKDLELPFEVTTQKIALLGGNGSGKTYLALKIEEEVLRAGGWTVIIDPVGVHYGLRLDKTGKKPSGIDLPVFGGLHGDVPLTPESGKLIADIICDRRLSVVLDVSQFESDAELNRFAADFGAQFWNRMKSNRRAVLVVLEEAQEFVPQNPMKGEEKKLHVFGRMAKLGRNYGIGIMMLSTRPQEINKKVLNLTQLMFAFQMTGTQERKAMSEWFSYAGYDESLNKILPTLAVGNPYVMSPRTLRINKPIHVLPKTTYDASATPDFDEESVTVSMNPIDIETLRDAMKDLIEREKENDPAALKREVERLKREVKSLGNTILEPKEVISYRDVPYVPKEMTERIDRIAHNVVQAMDELRSLAIVYGKQNVPPVPVVRLSESEMYKKAVASSPMPSRSYIKTALKTINNVLKTNTLDGTITTPEQRILDAIAWFESIGIYEPRQEAVAFKAGYTYGGGAFNNPRGKLNTRGLVKYAGKGISLTETGRSVANQPARPGSESELHEHILEVLPGTHRIIMAALLNLRGVPIEKEELSRLLNRRGGAFNNPLGRLRSMGLIDYPEKGMVSANSFLFWEQYK